MIQNWVVSHIQIIGEACNHVSEEMQTAHPEIPWSKTIGMRNILVHSYFDIDLEAVKAVLERDLPVLKSQIEAILRALDESNLDTTSFTPMACEADWISTPKTLSWNTSCFHLKYRDVLHHVVVLGK